MSKERIIAKIDKLISKSTSELAIKLESYRIDVSEEVPPPEIAWEVRNDD